MHNTLKTLSLVVITGLAGASFSAGAWWGGGPGYGSGMGDGMWDNIGDFFGDGTGDFDMSMSGGGSGRGYGRGHGYGRGYGSGYSGYGPYGYGGPMGGYGGGMPYGGGYGAPYGGGYGTLRWRLRHAPRSPGRSPCCCAGRRAGGAGYRRRSITRSSTRYSKIRVSRAVRARDWPRSLLDLSLLLRPETRSTRSLPSQSQGDRRVQGVPQSASSVLHRGDQSATFRDQRGTDHDAALTLAQVPGEPSGFRRGRS